MKKIFVGLITLLLLVGCSQNQKLNYFMLTNDKELSAFIVCLDFGIDGFFAIDDVIRLSGLAVSGLREALILFA